MYDLQAVFNDFSLTPQQLIPKAIPCQKYIHTYLFTFRRS